MKMNLKKERNLQRVDLFVENSNVGSISRIGSSDTGTSQLNITSFSMKIVSLSVILKALAF
jgi:hypothetical protein